jgi:hypothetical protein
MQISYWTSKQWRSFYLGFCYPGYWHPNLHGHHSCSFPNKREPYSFPHYMLWMWTRRPLEKGLPKDKSYQGPKHIPPGGKHSKMCPRCNKGFHWTKDCKSKYHADGRPLNGTRGNLQPHPKKEQFPVSSGKTPGVQDLISWS